MQMYWTHSLAVFVATAGIAIAQPLSFDFKDPKGVNNVAFKLDAPLEAISGSASDISGSIKYDPSNPKSLSGKLVVASKSLQVPNSTMKEHMLGEKWLDVAKHSEISFETTSVREVSVDGTTATVDVTGKLSLHGVTREMVVPVKLTFLKDKLGARLNGAVKGDLLVLRASFKIKRSDFGINKGAFEDKVSDEIELTLSLAGASPN